MIYLLWYLFGNECNIAILFLTENLNLMQLKSFRICISKQWNKVIKVSVSATPVLQKLRYACISVSVRIKKKKNKVSMQPSFYLPSCPHFSVYISFFSGNLTLPNQSKCPLSKGSPIGRKPGLHLFGVFSSSDVSSRMGICLYMNQWAPREHLLEAPSSN